MAAASGSSSLALSGLASGINWTSIINEMAAAASAPITQMQTQQTTENSQNSAYQTIGTDLTNLQTDVQTLSSPSFFETTTASSSDSTVASATTGASTPPGTYSFSVTQLASAGVQTGSTISAQPISSSSDVSAVDLSSSSFADPITAGTFTINGQTITVATTDTLQSVFNQINTATGGAVTASYNSSTDEISLSSSSPITLGSSADTSNFLQATQLYTNDTGSVTSLGRLAGVNMNNAAANSNLSTAITNGTGSQGSFQINGVTISFDSQTDSLNQILSDINNSSAGVTATYNGANHQFVLTNNNTGNLNITMQDLNGSNFLAATGLSSGTYANGTNLQYNLDGSSTLTSESNTIDATSMGLTGLSITAAAKGSANITVSPDVNSIATAITNFVSDYNAVQTYITSQTTVSTSTTSVTGAVNSTTTSTATPGLLMGDMDVEGIATNLRQLVDSTPLTGVIQDLSSLGITSSGQNNLLTTSSVVLNTTLTNNLSQISKLFTDPTNGLATTLSGYLGTTLGSSGVVAKKEANLTSESKALTTSITTLQSQITGQEAQMQNEFVLMEDAISTINVEKQYLNAYFSSAATTTSAPTAAGSSSSSSTSSTG